ncbi:hypothetical protein [Streptomyces ardesiacus]|uniref:hypothetical protein n=1 Tax=Streptomyces ardesiacus TaxID=285564 RepID=UPI00201F6F56|nr:hypothetical protein [Streptomyces ardesiacus]MCL7368536.1 hypothetical protein [Streptomyces ardesiacus]
MPLHAPLHAGEHRAVGPRRARSRRAGPDRPRIRLYGLVGVVVCAAVLPFAVASAGPPGDGGGTSPETVPLLARGGDGKAPASPAAAEDGPAPSALPPGPALAARCGPELTSPAGVEARTCVLARGAETWARTSYRNATGGPIESVLSLMGPEGRSVRMRCAVSAEDAPDVCETPPDTGGGARGGLAGYTAVAEFARRAGYGPLLLRAGSDGGAGSGGGAGSNSPVQTAR